MDFVVSFENDGKSVLSYLYAAGISHGSISKLKRIDMGITVNNIHVTVRHILHTGDVLSVKIENDERDVNESIIPVKLPVDIIYEDEHIIAANKPPFMPTHPSHKHFSDTLGNAVAYIYKERGLPFVLRPLGRLDANTSGLVILSKSRAVASFYFNEAKNNRIEKHYIAVLDGEMSLPLFWESPLVYTIDKPIKRAASSIITREVSYDGDALPAKTEYRLLYKGNGISIVDASPITGRTHQLRVHFASEGFPIIGDSLYGHSGERQLLHAVNLKLKAPFSDKMLSLYAQPPKDISDFVRAKTGTELEKIIRGCNF